MTHLELGKELQRLREELGATPEQISAWSGLLVSKILAIEAGEVASIYELDRLCHGLGVDPSEVQGYSAADPQRTAAWFRSTAGERLEAADLRLLLSMATLAQNLHFLQDCLDERSKITDMRKVEPVQPGQEWAQGYLLGEKARARLEKPNQPIPDLGLLLARLGVYVVYVDLSSPRIEAASLWQANGTPTILLNRKAGRVKYSLARRAILGHELCHLLHDGGEDEVVARVTLEEGEEGYRNQVEKRARAFSPAFLVPRGAAKTWWKRQNPAKELHARALSFAKYWGLSFEGALWHLKNCALMPEEVVHDLRKGPIEVVEFPGESSTGLEEAGLVQGWARQLIDRAWHEGVISQGRRRELFEW